MSSLFLSNAWDASSILLAAAPSGPRLVAIRRRAGAIVPRGSLPHIAVQVRNFATHRDARAAYRLALLGLGPGVDARRVWEHVVPGGGLWLGCTRLFCEPLAGVRARPRRRRPPNTTPFTPTPVSIGPAGEPAARRLSSHPGECGDPDADSRACARAPHGHAGEHQRRRCHRRGGSAPASRSRARGRSRRSMHVLFLPKDALWRGRRGRARAGCAPIRRCNSPMVDQRRYPLARDARRSAVRSSSSSSGPASGQWYLNTPSSTAITLERRYATMDLSATDAVSAWGITTGSDGIVIADVDTGVRFDHPDLLARRLRRAPAAGLRFRR